MPSRLENGPENSKSTRRDGVGRRTEAFRMGRTAGNAASAASAPIGGNPGGCDESPSQGCATASVGFGESNHGKSSSSKYTSEVITMRLALGTQMLYAPGD
eukprot:6198544-Pleurochrysis_carterae.AAC.1